MKRITVAVLVAHMAALPVTAGTPMGFLNHLSVNASASTYGVGGELAMPLGNYMTIRGAYNYGELSYYPGIQKYDVDFTDTYTNTVSKATVEIDPVVNISNTTYDLMLDLYPSSTSNLHFTIGTYVGAPDMANAQASILGITSSDPAVQSKGESYMKEQIFGDASVSVAEVRVGGLNGIRPYAGIGLGRAVPSSRVGLMMEFGAIMHGMPQISDSNRLLDTYDEARKIKNIFTREVFSGSALYPVIKMSLTFRLF